MARPRQYDREELKACISAGFSAKEIQDAMGMSATYVYTLVRRTLGRQWSLLRDDRREGGARWSAHARRAA